MIEQPKAPATQAPTAELPPGIPMSVAVSPCEGPVAGSDKWVCVVFSDLLFSMSLRLPVDQMSDLSEKLPGQIREACADARRLTTGLVLPSEVAGNGAGPLPAAGR